MRPAEVMETGRHRRRNPDLWLTAALAIAAVVLILFVPDRVPVVRVVLGFAFVLVVPGYALAAALFAGRDDLDDVERIVLSLGLSVVAVPIVGLVLHYSPWGIRTVPVTVTLASFTLLALIAAFGERRRHERRDEATVPARRSTWAIFRLVVVVAVAFAAVVVTTQALRPPMASTAFYLLGASDGLESYPIDLAATDVFMATLGIENHEGRPVAFRIMVPHIGTVWEVPPLDDGAVWEMSVTIDANALEGLSDLTFELYRHGDTAPFRFVRVAVKVEARLRHAPTRSLARGGATGA